MVKQTVAYPDKEMKVKWKWKSLSCVWLFFTPCAVQSMEFSGPEYWSGYPLPSLGDLPNPGIEARSPTLQADSLPAEPLGKPTNTRMGSLSLLQEIFPTQESNWGLLHCRQFFFFLTNWAIREAWDSGTFKIILFIYLFLALLSLRCCIGFSLVSVSGGYSLVVVCGLLIEVAFLVVEHRL